MSEIVFPDGAYVERKDARVSIFDRGFLFADGIYEVSAVLDGKLVDNSAHLARLDRSLAAIELACPMSHAEIVAMQREKAAYRLYTDLANNIDDPEMKELFLGLAQEEAKHKLYFEVQYDDQILKHN